VILHKAYQFRLCPTGRQESLFRQFSGCRRFLWNTALDLQKKRLDRKDKILGYSRLCSVLLDWKKQYPFLSGSPSQSLQQVLMDLDRAIREAFDRKNPKQFPVFKKKFRSVDSFRFPQGFKIEQHDSRVFLPRIGWVTYRNSRNIEGKPKQVTISRRHDGWYFSVQVEIRVESEPAHPKAGTSVGIDRGVKTFAAFSDGTTLSAENFLKRRINHLARLQRQAARKRGPRDRNNPKVKQVPSNSWKKQKTRIARFHGKIADARRDFLHKATTTICKSHAVVVLEDLKVRNMSASARGTVENPGRRVRQKAGLNLAILDQGWGEFQRQLEYKMAWAGGRVVLVNPAYTSQGCSSCGHISPENRKIRDWFDCMACGHAEDADVNAAKNVKTAGLAVSACGGLGAARPPMKQEPAEGAHAAV